MSDSHPEEATEWQKAVSVYARRVSKEMRVFGIEMTPEEAHEMALEELKAAFRQNLRDIFLKKITGE